MNDDQLIPTPSSTPTPVRRSAFARWGRPGAFAAAGLVAGGLLAGSLSANAAETTAGQAAQPTATGSTDQSQPQRPDEKLLTGTTAAKVRAAALGKYPGATVVRIETDSDGVYEAHLTTAAGTPVTVEVDRSFTVTGTEAAGPGGTGGPPGALGEQPGSAGSSAESYGT